MNLFKTNPTKIVTLAALSFFLIFFSSQASNALEVPQSPSPSYVLDNAQILSTEEEQQLNQQIEALKTESSNEIGIFTSPDLEGEDPAQFAVKVGRAWGIGTKDYNNGVIIIVSLTNPKRIFIGTGTGLEGALPDALAGQISRDEIAPKFKENKYYEGLSVGITSISNATKGEYKLKKTSKIDFDAIFFYIFFALFIVQLILSVMASTKSWWLGGIFGLIVASLIGAIAWSLLIFIVVLAIFMPLGLFLDYKLSKNYKKHADKKKHDSNYVMPWYFGGGSGSGGGFSGGGFSGGGGFGGGGGGSSW